MKNGTTLLLEVKGQHGDEESAKHQAAKRWCSAVNNWGKLGIWSFLECRDPHQLPTQLRWLIQQTGTDTRVREA
jgi:type III restriction enzyme